MNKTLPLCFLFVIIALLTAPGAGAQGNNTSPDLIPPETRPKDSLPLAALPNPHLYRMNYWVSGGFTAAAIAANVWAIPNLITAKDPISSGEIQNLNTAALNGFERWALKQDVTKRDQWDKSSDRVLQGTILASAVIGLDKNIRRDAPGSS